MLNSITSKTSSFLSILGEGDGGARKKVKTAEKENFKNFFELE